MKPAGPDTFGLLRAWPRMSRDSRTFAHAILCGSVDFDLEQVEDVERRAPDDPGRSHPACPCAQEERMLARQRQALILDRVRDVGGVRVAELARELGVSDMTVRRDLEILHERGPAREGARRRHGHLVAALFEPGFAAKSALQQGEKDAIAAAASELVEPGMAIAVSAGTTTHAMASSARRDPGPHRRDQLAPRRGRPPPIGGRARPDRDPDGRRRGPRRRRSSGPFAVAQLSVGPRRPRVHGRPRDGRQGRVHLPEPPRGRDRSSR